MRVPPFYAGFCLILLLLFGYAKLRGLEYWPGRPGPAASRSSGSSGSGSSSSRGSGGFFGSSSTHK